jgi:hypothetical protein
MVMWKECKAKTSRRSSNGEEQGKEGDKNEETILKRS